MSVFLSWPAVMLYLGVIVLIKYDHLIKGFLEKVKSVKVKDIELLQQAEELPLHSKNPKIRKTDLAKQKKLKKEIEELKKEAEEKGKKDESNKKLIDAQKNFITFLSKQSETFEFKYLTKVLVANTVLSLAHFKVSSYSKENFLNLIQLSPKIEDPIPEKEAIFNALLSNVLIEKLPDGNYGITLKGKRFLDFLKL